MKLKFENLIAWKEARSLVRDIYLITRLKPLVSDFGLSSQIQRAAVSVMSNIAEGFERIHLVETIQMYNIARSSCGEVRSLLFVIADNYPELSSRALDLLPAVESVGKLVSGLISSTRRRS